MHRIDGPGNVNGQFTEGDPAQGIEATVVTSDWANAVQEEIAAVIEQFSGALVKTNNGQLVAALLAKFATAVALNTLSQTVTGLSQTLVSHTNARNNPHQVSLAQLGAAAAASFLGLNSANGYRWVNGTLFQWGSFSASGSGVGSVNFPIAFPTTVFGVFPQPMTNSPNQVFASASSNTLANASITYVLSPTGNTIRWFAIGF